MPDQALPDLRRSPRYVDVAETAKIIRRTLRARFPAVRFSVRSSRYAGGSSINVSYNDGPRVGDVQRVVDGFQGSGFDGMIDLAYSRDSWLLPDGTATLAHSEGTERSRGSAPERFVSPPHPGAELVRFGADHVCVTREPSAATRAAIDAELRERYAVSADAADPLLTLDGRTHLHAMPQTEYFSTMLHREFSARAFEENR